MTATERIRRARFRTKKGGKTFKLTQKEAESFGVTGFIGRVSFQTRWTRRGPREIRPIRTRAFREYGDAEAEALALSDRYRDPIQDVEVYEVDSLGREVER